MLTSLGRVLSFLNIESRFGYLGQTLAALVIKGIGVGISFLISILITRSFGAGGVGSFALVSTTLMVASTFSLIGLDYILIRSISGDIGIGHFGKAQGTIKRVIKIVSFFSVLVAFTVFGVSSILVSVADGDARFLEILAACAWGVIPLAAIRIVSSTLRGNGRVLLGQFLDGPASGAVALIGLVAYVAQMQSSVLGATIIYYISIALAAFAGALVCFGDIKRWRVLSEQSKERLLASGTKILVVVLTAYVIDWAIVLSLSRVYSEVEVGVFRIAWQFSTLFNVIVVAFDAVSGPRIAAAWRTGDRAAIEVLIAQSRRVMIFIATPLLLAGMIWPSWFLGWFGPEFSSAGNVLRILVIGQIFNVFTGPVGAALVMTGYERLSLLNALLSAVISLAVLYFTMPTLGLYGAAIASAAALISRNLATAVEVQWIIRHNTKSLGG